MLPTFQEIASFRCMELMLSEFHNFMLGQAYFMFVVLFWRKVSSLFRWLYLHGGVVLVALLENFTNLSMQIHQTLLGTVYAFVH